MSDELAVRKVIEGIRDAFSALDMDAWLSHFNPQHAVVNYGAVYVAKSLEESRQAFAPTISDLKARGFSRTVLDRCDIRIIHSKSALAATQWTRLGQDNKVLEHIKAIYTLVKGKSGWRVAVVTVHDEDVGLFE